MRLVTALVAAAVLVCTFAFLFLHLQVGRDFTTRVADNFASGILHTSDDPFWKFRVMAWKRPRGALSSTLQPGKGWNSF